MTLNKYLDEIILELRNALTTHFECRNESWDVYEDYVRNHVHIATSYNSNDLMRYTDHVTPVTDEDTKTIISIAMFDLYTTHCFYTKLFRLSIRDFEGTTTKLKFVNDILDFLNSIGPGNNGSTTFEKLTKPVPKVSDFFIQNASVFLDSCRQEFFNRLCSDASLSDLLAIENRTQIPMSLFLNENGTVTCMIENPYTGAEVTFGLTDDVNDKQEGDLDELK